ncbi:MAG TPA: glycosyltransferase family 2 protein [Bacteroidia bacterium]|nr:glycosyltransferase family 2 protein [Bacteroidia bacterium]
MKKVSVIIPCRNEEKHIKGCIEAVLQSDYGIANMEVIVVDGMSDDSSREVIQEAASRNPAVKMVDNPGKLTPLAFNLGIINSTGEYVVIVGSRLYIDPDYISRCVQILESNPQIGCVGGKINNVYENPTSKVIAGAMASSFGVGAGNFRQMKEDGFTDTVPTPGYRKNIFEEIGLFDEALVRNQDDELNYRVLKKGYKIFFTVKTGMRYFVRASYRNLYRQYFQYGYWKVYVNRKHKTITTIRQLMPAIFVCGVITGLLLATLNRYFLAGYLSVLVLYFLLAFISAFNNTEEKKDTFKVVFSYLILHVSYGSGYLKGILHFLLLRRKMGSEQNKTLSR